MTTIITRDRIALIREALASDPDPLITMDATDVTALCDTADQWLRDRASVPGQRYREHLRQQEASNE